MKKKSTVEDENVRRKINSTFLLPFLTALEFFSLARYIAEHNVQAENDVWPFVEYILMANISSTVDTPSLHFLDEQSSAHRRSLPLSH